MSTLHSLLEYVLFGCLWALVEYCDMYEQIAAGKTSWEEQRQKSENRLAAYLKQEGLVCQPQKRDKLWWYITKHILLNIMAWPLIIAIVSWLALCLTLDAVFKENK